MIENETKKRIIYLFCGVTMVICFVIFHNLFFISRPVIADSQSAKVLRVTYVYDKQYGGNYDLTEYDETKILDYLSTCTETRTMHRANSVLAIRFYINTGSICDYNFKQILLGSKDNYSNTGYGSFKYEIENASAVLENVQVMLGL